MKIFKTASREKMHDIETAGKKESKWRGLKNTVQWKRERWECDKAHIDEKWQ